MSAKDAAAKVKAVLKDKVSNEEKASAAQMQSHECNHVKVPRMPTGLPHLFPEMRKKNIQRKANPVTSEWKKEVERTHACGCHVENSASPGADLIPARVKKWQLRGHHLIVRKIKALSKTNEAPSKHSVTHIQQQSSKASSQDGQDALWEEMIKAKEERQFQLGRITKYFS
jgi:hypothetical protein